MQPDEQVSGFARCVLATVSPDYAARRFDEISTAWVQDWSDRPAPYCAVIEALPTGEREKVDLLFAITVEQLTASDPRRAEIDELGSELVKELEALHSTYFMDFLNVFAPVGSALREEWESCLDGWGQVYAERKRPL